MSELKPCPFCGGEGVITDEDCYGFTYNDWMVYCENCQTYVGFGLQCETPEEAAEAWNRRTSYDNPRIARDVP